MDITVHYEDGTKSILYGETPALYYWNIGYKFDYHTGVFGAANNGTLSGCFEIVEKSFDGSEVWVEYHA